MGRALFLLLLPLVVWYQRTDGLISMYWFNCTSDAYLCQSMICNHWVSRNSVSKIDCGCFVPYPMYNMSVDIRLLREKGKTFETLLRTRENMCDVAKKTIRSQVMTRIFESIAGYFNNYRCPFEGNITGTGMPLSLSYFPGFLQPSKYRLHVVARQHEMFVLGVNMYFNITKNKYF